VLAEGTTAEGGRPSGRGGIAAVEAAPEAEEEPESVPFLLPLRPSLALNWD